MSPFRSLIRSKKIVRSIVNIPITTLGILEQNPCAAVLSSLPLDYVIVITILSIGMSPPSNSIQSTTFESKWIFKKSPFSYFCFHLGRSIESRQPCNVFGMMLTSAKYCAFRIQTGQTITIPTITLNPFIQTKRCS